MRKSTWYYPDKAVEPMAREAEAMCRCGLTSVMCSAKDDAAVQAMAALLKGKGPEFFVSFRLDMLYVRAMGRNAPEAVHSRPAVLRAKLGAAGAKRPLVCWSGVEDPAPLAKYLRQYARRRPFLKGVCLDYIRYPNAFFQEDNPCDCAACRARRTPWLGRGSLTAEDLQDPSVMCMEIRSKCAVIRRIVERVAEALRGIGLKPAVAARAVYAGRDAEFNAPPTWGYGPALFEGQDWSAWARDGLVDELHFMNYTKTMRRFVRLARRHAALAGGSAVLHEGLGVTSSAGPISPTMFRRQIAAARDLGMDGVTVFPWHAMKEPYLRALESA